MTMIAIVLLGFLACASAAPRHSYHHPQANEPSVQISDKEYKITLHLQSFDEKEVIVKAKKGRLVVQAVHKVAGEPESNYLHIRTLPDNVGENGGWTFENGLLKVVFPIAQVDKEIPTQTTAPDHSREEMGNNEHDKDQNEDIDEIRGDVDYYQKYLEIIEIPHQKHTVEATTYNVGLSDDMELVPMSRYYLRNMH